MTTISLLSSSPELPPRNNTKSAESSAPPKLALPSKTSEEVSKGRNEDFFTLSSDSVDVDLSLPPPARRASSNTVKPSTGAGTTSKSANISVPSTSVFFRSDDFDSTIVLDDDDDPFASDPPPAKKRRISPPHDLAIIDTDDMGISSKPAASKPSFEKATLPRVAGYKRSVSDIGASSKSTAPRVSSNGLKRSKTMGTVMEYDPIVFTSSPDPVADAKRRKENHVKKNFLEILTDSSEEDVFASSPQKDPKANTKATNSISLRDSDLESSDIDLPDLGILSKSRNLKPSVKSKARSKTTAMTALERYEAEKAKEKKRDDKDKATRAKAAAKEAEKEQKRVAKEDKAREKDRASELAKVNVLRTDKKKSTPEMIVDLPSCLEKRLTEQLQTFLKPVEAQYTEYESLSPIIKWRRKIDSKFNEEADHWEKVELYIGHEKHVMCIVKAPEFIELATGEEGKDLDSHVLRLKAKFASSKIIYLIEGLEPWMRKNKNLQNRKFDQQVRNQDPGEGIPTASQKRKKKPEVEIVDEDLVEDMLLKLQVVHGVLIHHTKVQIETAEWVVIFTQHISTVPYRKQEQYLDTSFCMASGQVKAGDGPADTYTKMLQEMSRVTAPIAYGIAAKYPSVQKLVKGLKEKGNLALEDCKKSANKDGAFTERRIGPSVSKRVYSLFTSRDVDSWDVS